MILNHFERFLILPVDLITLWEGGNKQRGKYFFWLHIVVDYSHPTTSMSGWIRIVKEFPCQTHIKLFAMVCVFLSIASLI